MRRFGPRRFLRALWDGFVVFGLLHALGESQPDDLTRRRAVYDEPPPGHPERLRSDLPLTALERRLARELSRTAARPDRT